MLKPFKQRQRKRNNHHSKKISSIDQHTPTHPHTRENDSQKEEDTNSHPQTQAKNSSELEFTLQWCGSSRSDKNQPVEITLSRGSMTFSSVCPTAILLTQRINREDENNVIEQMAKGQGQAEGRQKNMFSFAAAVAKLENLFNALSNNE